MIQQSLWRWNFMKKILATIISLLLVISLTFSCAEEHDRIITINLETASDEELVSFANMIKEEQAARRTTTIKFEPDSLIISKGKSGQVKAEVIDLADGVTAGEPIWKSSDESIAKISKGNIKGNAVGSATMFYTVALSDGTELTAELPVEVIIPIKSIKPKKEKIEVMAGTIFEPEITYKPSDASITSFTYSSADDSIVTTSEDGKLLAVAPGKTVITIKTTDNSEKTANVSVNVTKLIGKYDDELRFLGLEWGQSSTPSEQYLSNQGLFTFWDYSKNTSFGRGCGYWPENETDLISYSLTDLAPNIILENDSVGFYIDSYYELHKKIGDLDAGSINLYYISNVTNGKITDKRDKLTMIDIIFKSSTVNHSKPEIFENLLSKLTEQYGEFRMYVSKDLYEPLYGISTKELVKICEKYTSSITKGNYDGAALAVLTGKNNTGIALVWYMFEVRLIYGKTDSYQDLQKIVEVLEKQVDDRPDAGL